MIKRSLLPALFLAVLAMSALRADDPITSTIKFSQANKPGTLRVYIAHGALQIKATDSPDVVTVSTDVQVENKEARRPDGLRVIGSSASFTLTENDNVVDLSYGREGPAGGSADFIVTVPRLTSVEISNGYGSDVLVEGVMGDLEVKNMNGEVTLNNVGGGALVETMNGEIRATFASLTPGKPLSFTSMNGQIEVHLPVDAKANVRFRTQNGSILTDFPEEVLKTKTEPGNFGGIASDAARIAAEAAREAARVGKEVAQQVHEALRESGMEMSDDDTASKPSKSSKGSKAPRPPRPPRAPRPPSIPSMVGGKVVTGQLNGGGADLQIATMNGDIVVRKTTEKH